MSRTTEADPYDVTMDRLTGSPPKRGSEVSAFVPDATRNNCRGEGLGEVRLYEVFGGFHRPLIMHKLRSREPDHMSLKALKQLGCRL